MNRGQSLGKYFQGNDHLTSSLEPNKIYEKGVGETIVFDRIDKMRGFHVSQISEWEKTYGRLVIAFPGVAVIIEGDDAVICRIHVLVQQAHLRGVRERGGVSIAYSDDPAEEESDALGGEINEACEMASQPRFHPLDYYEMGPGQSILFYRLKKTRGFSIFKIQHWEKTHGRLVIAFSGVAVIIEGDDEVISRMHSLLLQGQLRSIKQIDHISIQFSDDD
jgi:hypothetical protein